MPIAAAFLQCFRRKYRRSPRQGEEIGPGCRQLRSKNMMRLLMVVCLVVGAVNADRLRPLVWDAWQAVEKALPPVKPAEAESYTPTEVQSLKLQLRQRDAQIAQKDLQMYQQRFQQAINDLQAEAEQIKRDNKWAADVAFDMGTLTFAKKPGVAEKKP
jgi:hypothetical protein